LLGIMGMPRRVSVYAPEFQGMNIVVSLAGFLLGIATFVLLYNMGVSMANGRRAGANPWRALTLEWTTSSPPPSHNFTGDPIPFNDPYGFGTEASQAYLDAIDARYGLPEAVEPALPAPTEGEESPEPAGGD